MSFPFAIWTMRRTGGTTLTDMLMTLSEHPNIDHEPFNEGRVFGDISASWYRDKDMVQTTATLAAALKERPLLKHCFEIHGPAFNRLLLKTLNNLGYRQIILQRSNEVARILSLQLAETTGVWGKMGSERGYAFFRGENAPELRFDIAAAQAHMEHCFQRWIWLEKTMQKLKIAPFRLEFEDLYGDIDRGKQTVQAIFEHLDFPPGTSTQRQTMIENALRHKGQNSGSMMSLVTNITQAQTQLQKRLDRLSSAAPS